MRHGLLGEYETRMDATRNLVIPHGLARRIELSEVGTAMSYPLILAPTEECIAVLPFNYYKRPPVGEWLHSVLWGDEIGQIVAENKVRACHPFYRTDTVSDKVRRALEILEGEVSKNPRLLRDLSGKDFERLLYEVLKSLGINVQLNVRLLGAEIDLLLLELTDQGQIEFTIVECKHRAVSGRAVGISQVMRVFGLREALYRDVSIKNAIIVTTTGLSPAARQFCQVYKMTSVDYDGFIDWATAHKLIADSHHYPVLRSVNLDKRNRFYAPTWLTSYLQVFDGKFVVLGLGDCMELWNPDVWGKERSSCEKLAEQLLWELPQV